MPLRTYDTREDYDSLYQVRDEAGRVCAYDRRGLVWQVHRPLATRLVAHFSWPSGSNILVLGCGFGWLIEELRDSHGYTNTWGVDTSPWIASAKSDVDPVDSEPRSHYPNVIVPEDLNLAQGRNALRQTSGIRSWDAIITEDMLTSLSDQECIDLSGLVRQHLLTSGGQVVHIVSTPSFNPEPGLNWKTLSDWKSLIPGDTFVHISGTRVL